jgi:hypothetical protein
MRKRFSTLISQLSAPAAFDEPHIAIARLIFFAWRFGSAIDQTTTRNKKAVGWGDLLLLDSNGQSAFSVPDDENTSFESGACSAVAIEMPPGNYLIRWPSGDPESTNVDLQPISLYSGWTTTIYAAAFDDSQTPRRSTVSIHMSRHGQTLYPQNSEEAEVNTAAELALSTLRTGNCQLSDEQLRVLLRAKFENPMLGLLGAHVLLLEQKPDTGLLKIVIENLRRLIGHCPDVVALELLAEQRAGSDPSDKSRLTFPPMLQRGLQGVTRAEWRQPPDDEEDILIGVGRLALLRDLADTPWTTFWHPKGADSAQKQRRWRLLVSAKDPFIFLAVRPPTPTFDSAERGGLSFVIPTPFHRAQLEAVIEAEDALKEYLKEAEARGGGRSIRPEHLRWTGLSRSRVSHLTEPPPALETF